MATASRVVWAPKARQDLRDIGRYYRRIASSEIADKVLRDIDRAAQRISQTPRAWRSREELAPGLRSVIARPDTVFYRSAADRVEIVRVLHERRDFPAILPRQDRSP